MPRILLLLILWPLTAGADGAGELIRLTPEQAKRAGLATAVLGDMKVDAVRRLPAQAVVPARNIEVLAAPLPALVVSVSTAYGESIRKGQVLARLQSPQVLELRRELLQARGQAHLAAESLKRDRSLFEEGIISAARLSATEVGEKQAAARLSEIRQALALAGAGEGALSPGIEIRAPFDGIVLEAEVAPGARVEAATQLFKLARRGPLWLEIQASPAQAAGLAVGDAVLVPGCAEQGRLSVMAPTLNPASQSMLLRAELARAGDCVKPFQFTQVEVRPAAEAGGRRVPNTALTRHHGQSWLFAEVPGGYRPIPVKVLDESEKSTRIAADLAPDSRIVISGLSAIKAVWLGLGGMGSTAP